MFFNKFPIAMIALALAAPAPALAQDGRVELQTSIQIVQASDDGDIIAPATTVVPGDRLEFHVTYRNLTGSTVTDFVVVNPVPSSVVVTPQSASQIEVSIDGGALWGPLASLAVTDEEGNRRPAAADDVTHLRWIIASLAPEQEGTVTYRAVVQ